MRLHAQYLSGRVLKPRHTVCRRCQSTATASSSLTPASTPRLRFAPSPTGYLHLGGLRTALFNHLLAKRLGGEWILRIEDTDQARRIDDAVDYLRESMEWAGLEYDEGPGKAGKHGPYIQSERLDLYQQHAKVLLDTDRAYHCFCTPAELDASRKSQYLSGRKVAYEGRCRHLTDEEVARRKKAGQPYLIRFKTTNTFQPALVKDLVFGDINIGGALAAMDDFIMIKSDGYPTYHLANVVDDHFMEISHVLRGEEWIPSTPKHLAIYKAFGWTPPQFAHLPLILGPNGQKLSKRKYAVPILDYRDQGYEPEAVVNYVALLGFDYHTALNRLVASSSVSNPDSTSPSSSSSSSSGSRRVPDRGPGSSALPPHTRKDGHSLYEIFTLPQLVRAFDISLVTRHHAALNPSKLEFLNKMFLRRKAGRLGKDGELVYLGKEEVVEDKDKEKDGLRERGGEERREVLVRLQDFLRQTDELKGCALVEDAEYVEKVFDAELPRIVRLSEMTTESTFFFLEPNLEDEGASEMYQSFSPTAYITNLEAVIQELEDCLARRKGFLDEDMVWDSARHVVRTLELRARSQVLLPMRHALTGQQAGPSVPATMMVLGPERSMARLRAGVEWAKRRSASSARPD